MAKPRLMQPDAEKAVTKDVDTEVFETMVSGLREHLFGPALEGVQAQLKQAQDLNKEIGALVATLVVEATKQAGDNGAVLSIDMVMGVATEIIDDLLDIAVASAVIPEATDEMREACMMEAIAVYGTMEQTSPEEKAVAMEQLQEMEQSGELEEGTKAVAKAGERQGIDPFAQGNQAPPQGAPPPPDAGQRPQLME